MGEAKRRGNREQRVEQARERVQRDGLEIANHPVDEDAFLHYAGVFFAAAGLTMPTANPETRTVQFSDMTLSFGDIPFNRGLLALYDEMRNNDIDPRTRMAMGFRVATIRTVVRDPICFERWVREDPDEPAAVQIDDALMRACASARFVLDGTDGTFDMADVVRIATEIEARTSREAYGTTIEG